MPVHLIGIRRRRPQLRRRARPSLHRDSRSGSSRATSRSTSTSTSPTSAIGHVDLRPRPRPGQGARSSTTPNVPVCTVVAPRSRGSRGRRSPRPASTEPELIRKPKAEDERRRQGVTALRAIVGLGNPGPEYDGHAAQRRVRPGRPPARRAGASARSGGRSGPARRAVGATGTDVRLIKPTDLHESERGGARPAPVASGIRPRAATCWCSSTTSRCPPGRFRLRGAGIAGGHNGLKSIEGALRRQDYARLRIGVGPEPAGDRDLADFVLGALPARRARGARRQLLDPMADAVECWLHGRASRPAMNRFNGR